MFEAFLKPFEGFSDEDFGSYEPEKWSSNLHNLPRMQVKQKLSALAAKLKPTVEELNLDLDHELSSERPSIWNQKKVDAQWLFYTRDDRAKKELQSIIDRHKSLADNIDDPAHHHRHAILAVRIEETGAVASFGVHHSAWLDRRNLERKWSDKYEKAKLLKAITSLSDAYSWIAGDTTAPVDVQSEATLESALVNATETDGWIAVEKRFPADDPRVATAGFANDVADAFAELAHLYRIVSWSRENDFADVAQQVAEEKKVKRRSGNAPFEENDHVQVTGGLFSGQRGVVMGYDRAGKIKVKVGNLTLPISAGALKLLSR